MDPCLRRVTGGLVLPKSQLALPALVALSIPLSAWGASYPPNTWLQLGPVLLLLLIALPLLRRFPLSTSSLACITAFLLLHDLAARWTYSDVPYDLWSRSLFDISIDQSEFQLVRPLEILPSTP